MASFNLTGADRWRAELRSYLLTVLFCLVVGIGLWGLGLTEPLWASLTASFAIGLSICTAFLLLENRLASLRPEFLGPSLITAAGLAIGLVIAGILIAGRPSLFFAQSWGGLVLSVFFGVVGLLIIGSRHRMTVLRAQLAEAEAGAERRARQMAETELQLLQAQIEPHFLFNTLSNIASLIHARPADAERTLMHLTTLLRTSLHRTRQEKTTLADELRIVRAYLEIQKIRMGWRLNYAIDVADALLDHPLPPLLLQPLVENAVQHGLEPLEAGGRVDIQVMLEQGRLVIEVRDTGRGMQRASGGMGISNIRERLRAIYGHAGLPARLHFTERNPGVCARLELPEESNDHGTAG